MGNLNVVVSVSDKYLWALAPFAHLFNKYWSDQLQVTIAGYKQPWFDLPNNFKYHSIAAEGYPKEKWADGFLKFLYQYPHDYFLLMLEDYWTCRKVNVDALGKLCDYFMERPDCLRIDVTADRLYAGGMRDIGYFYEFDIIEAPGSQYQMSLQAGMWNKRLMIDVLESLTPPDQSAWDVELIGNNYVLNNKLHVAGTRQWPVRYVNGMNNASSEVNLNGFTETDRREIKEVIHATVVESVGTV